MAKVISRGGGVVILRSAMAGAVVSGDYSGKLCAGDVFVGTEGGILEAHNYPLLDRPCSGSAVALSDGIRVLHGGKLAA